MNIDEVGKTSIIQSSSIAANSSSTAEQTKSGEFQKTLFDVLANTSNIKFSSHAIDRLSQRGVSLDDKTVARLDNAVSAADKKGAGQSLVLLDELAFLVSVKNRTVITALETGNLKEGVFTQIDSAVIG